MKRFHVHIAVSDLTKSIAFYGKLFGAEPTVVKSDYAKWMLDDPRVNFAISSRGATPGVNHLGVQHESADGFAAGSQDLRDADIGAVAELDAACCYAKSDKYWVQDPQGIPWETFHKLDSIPVFGDGTAAAESKEPCCGPAAGAPKSKTAGCCEPNATSDAGKVSCC